jgi:hypothetical protein
MGHFEWPVTIFFLKFWGYSDRWHPCWNFFAYFFSFWKDTQIYTMPKYKSFTITPVLHGFKWIYTILHLPIQSSNFHLHLHGRYFYNHIHAQHCTAQNQPGRGLWHEIQHNRAKGNVNKWTSLQTYKDKTRQPDYIHKYTHMSGNPKEWAKGRM